MLLEILAEIRLKKMLKLVQEGQFAEVVAELSEQENKELFSQIASICIGGERIIYYAFYAYRIRQTNKSNTRVLLELHDCATWLLISLSSLPGAYDLAEYHALEALKIDSDNKIASHALNYLRSIPG